MNIYSHSPKKFVELFKNIIEPDKYNNLLEIIKKYKFKYEEKFINSDEYEHFIKIFVKNLADFELLCKYQEEIKEYFQNIISEGDVLFDIGYGGRAEAALSNLLGFHIDSYYIHSNSEILNLRQNKYNFKNKCFYDYKPSITGVMREHLFMEQGPSVIGYTGGKPIFEEYKDDYSTHLITEVIQNAALDFVNDFLEIFVGYEDYMTFRKNDAAMPLEYYLHYSKPFDRSMFSNLVFEDDFGEGKKINALEFWNNDTERLGLIEKKKKFKEEEQSKRRLTTMQINYRLFLEGKPKWKKALFLLMFDRQLFVENVKKKLRLKKKLERGKKVIIL